MYYLYKKYNLNNKYDSLPSRVYTFFSCADTKETHQLFPHINLLLFIKISQEAHSIS